MLAEPFLHFYTINSSNAGQMQNGYKGDKCYSVAYPYTLY